MAFLRALRPQQWIKNVFVLAPIAFSYEFMEVDAWTRVLLAAVAFCLMSSAIYLLNDIADREQDRLHPKKKLRPVASGALPVPMAFMMALALALGAGALLMTLPADCLHILLLYAGMNFLYSLWLKTIAVLDVIIIALGFILRVAMGGVAADVPLSPWILATTFLLALFLGFGKRYHELGDTGDSTRASLKQYNKSLLDRLISISCGTTLMSYAIFVVDASAMHESLMPLASLLFVVFGLFRYLQWLYVEGLGSEPETILAKDPVFLLNALLWLGVTLYILQP